MDPWRSFLVDVGKQIKRESWQNIRDGQDIPPSTKEKLRSAMDVFDNMLQRMVFSRNNVSPLVKILRGETELKAARAVERWGQGNRGSACFADEEESPKVEDISEFSKLSVGLKEESKKEPPQSWVNNTFVAVLVTKEEEWKEVNNYLKNLKIKYDTKEKYLRFALPFDPKKLCVVALKITKGFEEVEVFANEVIVDIQPSFITTVGVCAGRPFDVGKAIFFTDARWKHGINVRQITIVDKKNFPINIWKEDDEEACLKPHQPTYIFTTKDSKTILQADKAQEELNQFQDIHGLDMEVAALYKKVEWWNQQHTEGERCTPLAAVKAVSDKSENSKTAMFNAILYLFRYLRWIASQQNES